MTKIKAFTAKYLYIIIATILLIVGTRYFLSILTSPAKTEFIFKKSDISVIITPHHDLVATQRDDFFRKFGANLNPKTVILISPDHFDAGQKNITTTDRIWKLANSNILPDSKIINSLSSKEVTQINDVPFEKEHGITNILANISANFPDAGIVPIIVKTGTSTSELDKLTENLLKSCDNKCLVIASIDFSHYQSASVAQNHDLNSLLALYQADENMALRSEVDSPEAVYLAIKWAKAKDNQRFELASNTNSGILANNGTSETTSYVFGWYQSGEKNQLSPAITFAFSGGLENTQAEFCNGGISNFTNFGQRFFSGVDLSFLSAKSIGSNCKNFNQLIHVLSYLNVEKVILCSDSDQIELSNGIKIANTCSNSLEIDRQTKGENRLSIFYLDQTNLENNLTSKIATEKKLGAKVLIYVKWGNSAQTFVYTWQRQMAKSWIDAGADAVFGYGPQKLLSGEKHLNKPIFYSLGSIYNDNTVNKSISLAINGKINPDALTLNLVPFILKDGKPQMLVNDAKKEIVNEIRKQLNLEEKTGWDFDQIEFNF